MTPDFLKVTSPLDGSEPKFVLESFSGEEFISDSFYYELELLSGESNIDLSGLIGKNMSVEVKTLEGEEGRYIDGKVARAIQDSNGDRDYTRYRVELRPWFWELNLTRDHKIFQNQTAIEIVKAIFDDLGYQDYEDQTGTVPPTREFCVQYGESAFNFCSRLLEAEGIFYYFKHEKGKHTLVLADSLSGLDSCHGLDEAKVRLVDTDWSQEDLIARVNLEEGKVSGKVTLRAYNFEAPATVLSSTVAGSDGGSLEVYNYPGPFDQASDGENIAKKRIEALEAPGKSISGSGFCRAFAAGYTFSLKDHGKSDANADYVLSSVRISAGERGYSNHFRAFLKSSTFRPSRRTGRPPVPGVQTALVVGPEGDEIYTDKYGRIKVQFHWDRDGEKNDQSSCWIRVAQFWAGKSWGSMFIPRVGQEVVVQFLNGNPDTPLVIGMLYNGTNTVPYTLPDNATRSTIQSRSSKEGEAGNEICFEDTRDSENFYVHAQKDLNSVIENNRVDHIKNYRQVFVTAEDPAEDDSITDLLEVNGQRKITVKGDNLEEHVNEGEFKQSVTKNFTLTVDGDTLTIEASGDLVIKGKTVSIESTGGDFTMKSSANLSADAGQSLSNTAGTDLTNKSGTSLTNQSGTDLTNKSGTNLTNDAGVSLTNKAAVSFTTQGSASGTVDGGGMLTIKGGLVKIN